MAEKADGSIYIKTEIDTTDAKASVKEITALLKRLSTQVESIGNSLKKSMSGGFKIPEAKGLDDTEEKAESVKKELENVSQAEKQVSNIDIKSTAFDTLEKAIESTGQKLAELEHAQMEIFNRNASATGSPAFQAMENTAEKLDRQYDILLAKKKQLENASVTQVAQPMQKTTLPQSAPMSGNYSATATSESQKALDNLNKEINKTKSNEQSLVGTNNKLNSSYKNVSQNVNSTKNKTSGASSIFSKMGSAASGLGKKLGGLAQNFLNTSKNADSAKFSVAKMVGMSILYSTVFGLISKVNSGIMSGVNNLSKYSSSVNTSMSSMMSALTRLQNSLATAFAPILSVVAPILTTFMNMLSRAITYVGMFFAALTGQKTFTKAVAVQEDYAASLDKTSSNANKAAKSQKKANKEAKTYLSGLDEIRQYEKEKKDDNSGSSTPSTGGGGYKGPSPSDMFETVPIENSISDVAKKLKDLVKNEDWEGLGAYIASGINKGLQKIYDVINWNNVGPKITYFVNAFTKTFNSLVGHIDWDLMGRTVGAGINTIVNTLNLLLEGIDWKNLGSKIAEGINGLFNEVNWDNVGRLFANKINVPFQMLEGAVNTLNWAKIGTSISGFLNGAINQIDVQAIGSSLSGLALGIFTTLDNALTTTNWSQLGIKLATLLTSIDWVGILVSAISVAGKAVTALTQLGVSFMDKLSQGITSGTQKFLSKGLSALTEFTANLRTNAGKLVDSGLQLMLNLAKGIAKAMPDIIKNVPQIVINIAGVINDNAPKILVAGIKLIAILIKGLIQSIPTLVASIPKIIEAIVSAFTAFNWLSLGKSLIVGIKNGIMGAKTTAVNAIKNVYNALVNGIKGLPSKLKSIGMNGVKSVGSGLTSKLSVAKTAAGNILKAVVNAIKNLPSKLASKAKEAITSMKDRFKDTDWGSVGMNVVKGIAKGVGDFAWILVDKMTSLANKAWEGVKDFFGIHSPSRLMRDTVGKMIPAGITVGLEKAFPDTMNTLMDQSKQLANVPFKAPVVASGAVLPAKAKAVISKAQNTMNDNDLNELIQKIIEAIDPKKPDDNPRSGGSYEFIAQINRRTLFDEMITEAKLRQMGNGKNPFVLA